MWMTVEKQISKKSHEWRTGRRNAAEDLADNIPGRSTKSEYNMKRGEKASRQWLEETRCLMFQKGLEELRFR